MVKRKLRKACRGGHCLLAAAFLILTATGGRAEDPKPRVELKLSMAKEVVRVKEGRRHVELVAADKAARGDILLCTVRYLNSGTSAAKNVAVVDPIPANTVYIPGSAAGHETKILFSINGGAVYLEPPVNYKGREANGIDVVKPAPPEMYTHVKWIVKSLKPGEAGTATFKVRVK